MPADASVGAAAAAVAKPAPLRKSLRSTSVMARPPCSVRPAALGLPSPICLSSIAPAPTTRPPTHANRRRGAGADALALRGVDLREGGRRRQGLDRGQRMQRLAEAGFLLGAAEAGMPGADRPRAEADVAETDRRAVGVGLRTLAADLVEAETLTVAFVAELEREAPGVEMRPPLAVLVDQAAIGEFRPVLLVELGRPTESQQVEDGRQEIVGAGRAAGNVDHQSCRE